jgi:hypothetical protein
MSMRPAVKGKLAAALILLILVALVALGLAAREADWWEYAFAVAMLLLVGLVAVAARRMRSRQDGGDDGQRTPDGPK